MQSSSPGLLDILRSVLARLDEDAPDGANDPALLEFKRRILRSIAQLELERKSLQPPDVLLPATDAPAGQARLSVPHMPSSPESGPGSSAITAAPPQDSVVVLVARRPRKPPDGGGESSAA